MFERSFSLGLLTALLLTLGAGCKRDAAPGASLPSASQQSEAKNQDSPDSAIQKSKIEIQKSSALLARLHWLGKKRLATETNAAYFMSILALPESTRLAAQTLDKLALAPWLSSFTNHQLPALSPQEVTNAGYQPLVAANPSAALLRPLLEDLLQEESYLEARQPTNHPLEAVLAIRLSDQRAGLWQTNLAAVLGSLAHNRPVPAPVGAYGWQLPIPGLVASKRSEDGSTVLLARSGEWTLIGLGQAENNLVADMSARIARDYAPFGLRATNYWIEADLDFAKLAELFPLVASKRSEDGTSINWPTLDLRIVGDGQNVRTYGELKFPKPLPLELDAWNIPTNLIHDPLVSFTAIRGLRPWLKSFKPWLDLQAGDPPNQAYFWGLEGLPVQDYCALPFPGASNAVRQLSEHLLQTANPWIQANRWGQLARTNFNGLFWRGAPFISPELRFLAKEADDFAFVGLIPLADNARPVPPELLKEVLSRTNLLYYDWEITDPRLAQWVYLSQLSRLISHRAQLPPSSAGFRWLNSTGQKLGNCVTLLSETGPDQLGLVRRSSFGLNSAELQLLGDWLESPQFPVGLHSCAVEPPPK